MKNTIKYYYGLEPSSIHQKDKIFYFLIDNFQYILIECANTEEINEIYKLSSQLLQIGIYVHQLIPNLSSQIITKINDKNYLLLKLYTKKKEIDINDIIDFNNIQYPDNPKLRRNNWYLLWTKKIDYLEYQISQIGKKYPIIIKTFSYYVGLAENAISLIKNIPVDKLPLSLNHRRIMCKDSTYNLYNPLNIIIDLRIRDVCEYFKSCFFKGEEVLNLVKAYLFYNRLEYNEACYFFARLLFPTYYFDVYEKIINNEIDETYLNDIVTKVDKYELFLKNVYLLLKNSSNIPSIEWLDNISLD